VLRSAPGLGPVLAARLLAEIGDDPARFATTANLRAFAGTAPVTRACGKARWVQARRVRNKRLADAGPRTATGEHVHAAPDTHTPSVSSPAAGSESSGPAGQPTSPTTPPATTQSNNSPPGLDPESSSATSPDSSTATSPPTRHPAPPLTTHRRVSEYRGGWSGTGWQGGVGFLTST